MRPFKLWGFNLHPFVLIGTFAGVVVFTAIGISIWRIQMRQIEPRNIEQRNIDQRQLSTVRDLEGTWTGRASFNANQRGRCAFQDTVTLVINNQTENNIAGTITFTDVSGTPTAPAQGPCHLGTETSPINADVSGTRIENLNAGTLNGTYAGSYTQDTITLNQAVPGNSGFGSQNVMNGPANLLKQ